MENDLRLLEKQLTDFIGWLAENRQYHEGMLYCDMKDYIARKIKLNKLSPEEFLIDWEGKDDSTHPDQNIRDEWIKRVNQLTTYVKLKT